MMSISHCLLMMIKLDKYISVFQKRPSRKRISNFRLGGREKEKDTDY